jgi:hypothetical protein
MTQIAEQHKVTLLKKKSSRAPVIKNKKAPPTFCSTTLIMHALSGEASNNT